LVISCFKALLLLVSLSRQRRHKVWLPSLASVIRERLFKMVRIWSDVRKDVSNQDGSIEEFEPRFAAAGMMPTISPTMRNDGQ
jgi:hypothetical protein